MVTTADAIKLYKGRGVTGSTLEAITWQKQTYISYIKTKTFILPMEVVEQQTSSSAFIKIIQVEFSYDFRVVV